MAASGVEGTASVNAERDRGEPDQPATAWILFLLGIGLVLLAAAGLLSAMEPGLAVLH